MKRVWSLLLSLTLFCTLLVGVSLPSAAADAEPGFTVAYSYDNAAWETLTFVWNGYSFDGLPFQFDTTKDTLYLKPGVLNGKQTTQPENILVELSTHGSDVMHYTFTNDGGLVAIPMSYLRQMRDEYDNLFFSGEGNDFAYIKLGANPNGENVYSAAPFVGVYTNSDGKKLTIESSGRAYLDGAQPSDSKLNLSYKVDAAGVKTLQSIKIYTYSANLLFTYNASAKTMTYQGPTASNHTPPSYLTQGMAFSLTNDPIKPATSITLSAASIILKAGETYQLRATVQPADSQQQVAWTSDGSYKLSVRNGLITSNASYPGVYTVTATVGDQTAACKVTVLAADAQFDTSVETAPSVPALAPLSETDKQTLFDSLPQEALDALTGTDSTAQVTVQITVTALDPEADAAKLAALQAAFTGKEKPGVFLDISLQADVDGAVYPIDSTARPLSLTVDIPEALRGANRTFFLYREHNGVIEKLEGTLSPDGAQLTFASNQFSAYALGYSESAQGGNGGEDPEKPSAPTHPGGSADPNAPSLSKPNDAGQTEKPGNPDTGDSLSGLYLAGTALVLCAGGLVVLLRKRAW